MMHGKYDKRAPKRSLIQESVRGAKFIDPRPLYGGPWTLKRWPLNSGEMAYAVTAPDGTVCSLTDGEIAMYNTDGRTLLDIIHRRLEAERESGHLFSVHGPESGQMNDSELRDCKIILARGERSAKHTLLGAIRRLVKDRERLLRLSEWRKAQLEKWKKRAMP